MGAQDEQQDVTLANIEVKHRHLMGRLLSRPTAIVMWLGVLLVTGIWLLNSRYTQFLWYGGILAVPALIASLPPVFAARSRQRLRAILFWFSTAAFAFIVPFLVPEARRSMAIS